MVSDGLFHESRTVRFDYKLKFFIVNNWYKMAA